MLVWKLGRPHCETSHVFSVTKSELPADSLLGAYQERGHYTDCYYADVAGSVSLAQCVSAFYTTPLFKLERAILARAVSKPSTDEQALELADGALDTFAAWRVEAREDTQLLMCDFRGQTRSWFMRAPQDGGTRLYFGSAVVAPEPRPGEKPRLAPAYAALLPFHRLYSRALLSSAKRKLSGSAQS